MKNTLFIPVILCLIFFSCSDESFDEPDMINNDPVLTNYIYKTYNVSNTPNTESASTNYTIAGDKIMSSIGTNLITLSQQTSEYDYIDDKIDEIKTFTDGALTRFQSFNYNSNGDLTEYITQSLNFDNQTYTSLKHIFTHTTDTIFSNLTESSDGINYGEILVDYKFVLDENNNRTYIEKYDYYNGYTHFDVSSYDSNSNILNESKYWRQDNGNDILSYENNYTPDSFENNYNKVWEGTLTRKNLMLLYHLQSFALNDINAKSISKNNLNTYQSTWGDSFASFDITNLVDSNDYTIFSDFKTILEGEINNRFTIEYIFE